MCIRDRDTCPSRISSKWEYIPGKKNVVADVLSRVNVEEQTFEGEKESILKIYHLLSIRADLTTILTNMSTHQHADPKLRNLKTRLEEGDETVAQYYQLKMCIRDRVRRTNGTIKKGNEQRTQG